MPFVEIRPQSIYKAPGAPSSVATRTACGTLIHIAGQTPRDQNGDTVGLGDIGLQTHQVMLRLKAIVEDQGGTLADICRMLIFITDPAHLAEMMAVRREYFQEPYPASTAVIAGLANPEWLIEIEATAALPTGIPSSSPVLIQRGVP